MKTAWTTGVKDAENKEEIKKLFKDSYMIRQRLIEILSKKQNNSWNGSISKESYENVNWALLQADARGYERALNEVISLISGQS